MRNILKPSQTAGSIYDINLKNLWNMGYHNMIIDIDNTITAWNQYHIHPKLESWIQSARDKGFHICLLSNNSQHRVQQFASQLGVIAAPTGGKPFARAFRSALTALQSTAGNTLVIGDQIFTDILGGNRAGLYTILVDPIDTNEFIGTRFTRLMERLFAGRRPACRSHQEQR
jgi:HAD superfamily phosphatase (TIGR01668 family)